MDAARDNRFRTARAVMTAAAVFFCALIVSGCAGTLPGGSDASNESFYDSTGELKSWVESLEPGMSKGEVFARLGRRQADFERLTRSDVIGVLFGGRDAGIPEHFKTEENIMQYLDSLEGYRMDYKRTKRKHGFASPIRIQTDEKGFGYELSLVFKNGVLYQKPYLSGGIINATDTKTIFDYLNPGFVLNRAID